MIAWILALFCSKKEPEEPDSEFPGVQSDDEFGGMECPTTRPFVDIPLPRIE